MLKKRLKPVYLLFLVIPLVYCLLWNGKTRVTKDDPALIDYFNFSVRTSKPAVLSMITGKDTLIKWHVNSSGYKDIEYAGNINGSVEPVLSINDLTINDTISFLGFNLYHKNHVHSLYEPGKNCSAENAVLMEKNGILHAIVKHSGKAVRIKIKPNSNFETEGKSNHHILMIVLIFVIVFLLLLAFAPPARYFIVSVVISLMVMIICYMTAKDCTGRVTLASGSPIKRAEIFYNQNPFFSGVKRFSSDNSSKSYSVPINFETDGFLRCDVGDSPAELKGVQFKTKLGVFGSSYDFASMPQGKLILNDLVLRGNTYYITGNDPYFKLISTYFIDKIKWLLFLQHNIFLFITLIVFLILAGLHSYAGRLNRIKFKWAYFAFLLIPLTYCLITRPWIGKPPSHAVDQIYFSIRTSKPSVIILFNGNDSIRSWEVNSPGFKYFQYSGNLNESAGFQLMLENLSVQDTISLLSINLFHDDHVYSLFDKNEPVCTIKNAQFFGNSNEVNATVQRINEPVTVSLPPYDVLKKDRPDRGMNTIVILIIFITFILVVILAPRARYFIATCIITSLVMLIYYWLGSEILGQVTISTSTPLKSTGLLYNNHPAFTPTKKLTVDHGTLFFKSFIDIAAFNYLRCDFQGNEKELKDISICAKTGILRNSWDYSTIPSGSILMNDMVRRSGTYYIRGNDPYFVLTSASQVHCIQWQVLLRQNIFYFLAVLLFLVLLFMRRIAQKQKLTAFILAVVSLVLISCGLVLGAFNSDRLLLSSEMRYANQLPAIRVDSPDIYTQNLDNYLKDQITGRTNIITANNLAEFSIFRELMNDRNVHFGINGWMFYTGARAREAYENRHPLTAEELKKMKDVLLARRDWLRERGIHFYIMFVPMSYFIYEEKIGPRMYRHNKISKLDQLLAYLKLHSDLDIIDIYTPMFEAKKKYSYGLYYKEDPHWNYAGAYIAYRAMTDHIKKDFPDVGAPLKLNDFYWFDIYDNVNVLLKLIAVDKYYTNHEYYPICWKQVNGIDTLYPAYPGVFTPEPPVCMVNKTGHHPSMLMYRDSFAFWLMAYLTNHFSRSTYLWTPIFYPAVVEKEKPDMVILEMADYVIYDILATNPPLPEKADTIHRPPD